MPKNTEEPNRRIIDIRRIEHKDYLEFLVEWFDWFDHPWGSQKFCLTKPVDGHFLLWKGGDYRNDPRIIGIEHDATSAETKLYDTTVEFARRVKKDIAKLREERGRAVTDAGKIVYCWKEADEKGHSLRYETEVK